MIFLIARVAADFNQNKENLLITDKKTITGNKPGRSCAKLRSAHRDTPALTLFLAISE